MQDRIFCQLLRKCALTLYRKFNAFLVLNRLVQSYINWTICCWMRLIIWKIIVLVGNLIWKNQIFSNCKMLVQWSFAKKWFASFLHFKLFWTMKFLLLKLKLFLQSESIVSIKYGTGYHFVSIDFHEFEIDGIVTPTMKICWMKNK